MDEVRNIATYKTPIVALHNGRPVKLIATGDQAGRSPVEKFVDENGKLGWGSQNEFQVIDTFCLPPSRESLNSVLGNAATRSTR
jgi:hypothetical protein